ncbi:MAG: MCP four helix bundle domain-containing protein, partial [Alphaproteobacteria bacterium]|nr:MCP four helix bundle domain-containing protein [Alphaproteobacteria bacterium]
MQLTIKTKLLLVLASLTVVLTATAAIGWIGLALTDGAFRTVYRDRVLPLQQLKTVSDMYSVTIPTTAHKVRDGSLDWDGGVSSVDAVVAVISQQWSAYLATYLTPEEQGLAAEARVRMAAADQSIARLRAILVARDTAGLSGYVLERMYPAIDPVIRKIEELVDLQRRVAAAEFARANRISGTSEWVEIALMLVALMVAVMGGWVIIGGVVRPLTEMTEAVRRTAGRDFTAPTPSVARRDEIGAMAAALEVLRSAALTTDRLRDENKEQRAWLERLLDELPVGITIFDKQQKLIVRNSTMNRLHPHPDPKRLLGTTVEELVRAVVSASVSPLPEKDVFVRDLAARYQSSREGQFEAQFPGGAEVNVYFRWIDDKYLVL